MGYALMAWNWASVVWVAFCLSTFLPRAHSNHRFYVTNFPEAASRRRLIPFVY